MAMWVANLLPLKGGGIKACYSTYAHCLHYNMIGAVNIFDYLGMQKSFHHSPPPAIIIDWINELCKSNFAVLKFNHYSISIFGV